MGGNNLFGVLVCGGDVRLVSCCGGCIVDWILSHLRRRYGHYRHQFHGV